MQYIVIINKDSNRIRASNKSNRKVILNSYNISFNIKKTLNNILFLLVYILDKEQMYTYTIYSNIYIISLLSLN